MLKLSVSGSMKINEKKALGILELLNKKFDWENTTLLVGDNPSGVDRLALENLDSKEENTFIYYSYKKGYREKARVSCKGCNYVAVESNAYGRAFNTVKDEKMISDSDIVVVIHSNSQGSLRNIQQAKESNKKLLEYYVN